VHVVKRAAAVAWLAAAAGVPSLAFGQTGSPFQPRFEVVPVETDNGAGAVAAFWRYGLGCAPGVGFGCPTVPTPPPPDPKNQGLILSKTVISADPAKAIAEIRGVKGTYLMELGYDLRKFLQQDHEVGSECTVTSPRFEITMADGSTFFIPCALPSDVSDSLYWRRLLWDAAEAVPSPTPILACPMPVKKGASCNIPISCPNPSLCGLDKRMQSLRIVADQGPDSDGPSQFGLSVLDNIDVNGRLVGTGPGPRNGDEDEGQGRDKDGREFYHRDSPSHPEQGVFEFHDPVANFNLIGTGGVLGIAYSVGAIGQPCVSFSGNGIVNGGSTYHYTFLSCDLSAVGTDLGTYSITATGPLGTLPYTQTGSLVTGSVSIHGR
jgi:hypothetical protein